MSSSYLLQVAKRQKQSHGGSAGNAGAAVRHRLDMGRNYLGHPMHCEPSVSSPANTVLWRRLVEMAKHLKNVLLTNPTHTQGQSGANQVDEVSVVRSALGFGSP